MIKRISKWIKNEVVGEVLSELRKEENGRKVFKVDISSYLDDSNYDDGIQKEITEILEEMTEDKRKEFLGLATQVANNKAFIKIVDSGMNTLACHSVTQSPNDQAIMFDRAGINELQLLKAKFKKLDALYKEFIKPEEEFDKNEVV